MTFLKKIAFILTYALLSTLIVLELFEYVYPHPCVYDQKFDKATSHQPGKSRLAFCFLVLLTISILFFIIGLRMRLETLGAALIGASNLLYLYSFYLIAHYFSCLQILFLTLITFGAIFYSGLKIVHKRAKNHPIVDESVKSGI